MKVLMIGATGAYAGLVLPELTRRGVVVRALARDEDKAEAARRAGARETALGDLRDAGSLRAAAEGVDGVFHIGPAFAPDEAALGLAMVGAAQAAGVRKFVFSSVYHPSLSLSNHAAKRPVEEALYDSDLEFTVLQPSMFMQMLAADWDAARKTGRITRPYSESAKMCYVDYRDVAEAAALALTSDALAFGTFELCAPGMASLSDLAALIGELAGRPVAAETVAPGAWADAAHLPDGPLRAGLATMNTHYDRYGFHGGNGLVLRAVLGREPRTLRAFFEALAPSAAPPV